MKVLSRLVATSKNNDKQLSTHIMNNMCDDYNQFKLFIENKENYLDDLEYF